MCLAHTQQEDKQVLKETEQRNMDLGTQSVKRLNSQGNVFKHCCLWIIIHHLMNFHLYRCKAQVYSPYFRSLCAHCAYVSLSQCDYANAIKVSLSVQRHQDESEANLTCYTSHLLSYVQHQNANVTALTQRHRG